MNKIIAIFLLTACFLPLEYSFAQDSKALEEEGIVTVAPNEKTTVGPDSLLCLKLPQVTLFQGKKLESKLPLNDYQAALEAAKIDPGILIFPDSTIGGEIVWIKPKEKVDPQMIVSPSEDRCN